LKKLSASSARLDHHDPTLIGETYRSKKSHPRHAARPAFRARTARRDHSIIAQWLGQKPDIAARSYEPIGSGFSSDGMTGDATWQALIETRVQGVGLPRPASLGQVRDLTLARELQKDLRLP
jgi:hypothetical protein